MFKYKKTMNFFIHSVAAAGPIDTAPRVVSILTNILNFLLSVVGIVAIIGIVIGGAIYFFAAGDMSRIEQAKKVILASVIGLVVVLGSVVLVRLLASFLG